MGTQPILIIISFLVSINYGYYALDIYVYEKCQSIIPCTTLDSLTLSAPFNLQFSSGTHYLHKPSNVIGGHYFGMTGTDTTIVCVGVWYNWFNFYYVQKIEVSGIKFVNCSGISYSYVSNLKITNSAYFGCRSSNCLHIRDSTVYITDVAFTDTIVGHNLVIFSSAGTAVNISMTDTACYYGLLFINHSSITLTNFNSRSSYGIILDIKNGTLILDNFQASSNTSNLCGLLHSKHASIKIYNSFIHYSCSQGAIEAFHSNLEIYNSTFLGSIAGATLDTDSELQTKYGTALKASLSNVTIKYSQFKYFYHFNGGAIEIRNNSNLMIKKTFFVQNWAQLGGAIKIDHKSTLTAFDSTFLENQAYLSGGAIHMYNATVNLTSCYINGNKATNTGGGGVYVESNGKLQCQDTKFLSNYAPYGGALAAYKNSNVVIIRAVFDSNTGLAGGPIFIEDNCTFYTKSNLTIQNNLGGIMFLARSRVFFLGYQLFHHNEGSLSLSSCSVSIEGITDILHNCHYTGNSSDYDYVPIPAYVTYPYNAMSIYSSVVNVQGQLSISNNAMGGIGCIEGTMEFKGSVTLMNNLAISASTPHGLPKGGGIVAYQCILHYYGFVYVVNNSAIYGGGIYASTTNQFYHSDVLFNSNTAKDGGALYLDLNSKLILEDQSDNHHQLKFNGNRARHNGGGMFVNDRSYFGVCSRDHDSSNPEYECFIQHTGISTLKTISFSNNTAASGRNLYGGLLNRCTLISEPQTTGMAFFKKISSFSDNSVTSGAMQLCICFDLELNCSITSVTMAVFKGQTVELNMTAIDQASESLETTVSAIMSESEVASEISGVGPGQLLQRLPYCSLVRYNVHSTRFTEHLQLYPDGPCLDNGVSTFTIHLNFKPCPNGFQELNGTCKCHHALVGNTCDIDTGTITRNTPAWISYNHLGNSSGLVVYSHCPYDYCLSPGDKVTINLQVEGGADSQCDFNRTGVLCGRCQRGLSSVLGSSKCLRCSNVSLLLLLPLAMLGVLVVVAMLTLNITVEVRVFNEMILFANLVGINYGTFFPPHQPTYYSTLLVDWINLNLGFETCFYNGLDQNGKVWLEVLFPCYLFVLAYILVIMKHRINTHWVVKLFRERNPKAVLATVLLLVFNKFLTVLQQIFSYGTLKYPNGTTHTIWVEDGSVTYLSGSHIALVILGILMTAYVLVFVIVLLTSQNSYVQSILNKIYLKSIVDSYHATYRSSRCSWPGLLLLYRVVTMVMAAVITPYHKFNLLLFTTATFCVVAIKDMTGSCHLHTRYAVVGNVYLSSLGFLAIIQFPLKNWTEAIVGITTVSFISMLSIGVITWHIYSILRTAASCWANRATHKKHSTTQMDKSNNPLPKVLVNSHTDVVTTSFLDI